MDALTQGFRLDIKTGEYLTKDKGNIGIQGPLRPFPVVPCRFRS